MSDFEHDDPTLLASLYLDGEATPDERALVETSPEAMLEVERLGELRTVLNATAPEASLSVREGHLAAALDVWERMSDLERSGEVTPSEGLDAAAAAAVTTPISDTRRNRGERRNRRLGGMSVPQWALSAAAALIVIAGVGAVVRGVLVDDGTDTAEVAVEAVPADPDSEVDVLEAAEAEEVQGGNVGADVVPAESNLSDEAAESGEATAESGGLFEEEGSDAATDAPASADEAEGDTPGAEQPAPPAEIDLEEIETADDLAAYGSLAVLALDGRVEQNDDIDFEAPFGTCEDEIGLQEHLEPVTYQGAVVGVGVDLVNSVVYAYDLDDCTVVETVALPTETGNVDEPAPSTQP